MARAVRAMLEDLVRIRPVYGGDAARQKFELVCALERATLSSAKDVVRLHETLLFLLSFPDDPGLLAAVERGLARFDHRRDLRRHRKALADSGIAGTRIHFPFFWITARWLAGRWPKALQIDWPSFDRKHELEPLLPHLLPYCETLTLDQLTYPPRTWIRLLKGPDESEAAFLVKRFDGLDTGSFGREFSYDRLAIPMVLLPGEDTPSRTRARLPQARIHFQRRPLHAHRPDLHRAAVEPIVGIRKVGLGEADRLIALARGAMITRGRDLDAFANADRRDVRLIDCGEGLSFACLGVVPERRLMLEAVYGFLTLKNGVPIGYVLASALFGSSEVAYNVFETWRGAESAHIYGRVLAMLHALFGSTTFAIPPYQLGHDNEEGQQSGAWWFYYKLGFRAVDTEVKRLARREVVRVRANPKYRSSPATVNQLAAAFMFLHLGREREDVIGGIAFENVGLRITRFLARRYGSERERAVAEVAADGMRLIGVTSLRGWTRDQRRAGQRWSPLIVSLPGIARWSAAERRALQPILKAKGGRRESEFVDLFDRHPKLRRAILQLARDIEP